MRTLSTEEVQSVEELITKLVYKKYRCESTLMNFEDLKSELWLTAIKVIRRYDDRVELNLIARSCLCKFVDLTRKSYGTKEDATDFSTSGSSNEYDSEVYDSREIKLSDDFLDNLYVEDIVSLFEVGSKEREFVNLKLASVDMSDSKSIVFEEKDLENQIARALGFAGGCSSGYRKVRNNVREAVKNYRESTKSN